jgi:hypothetical protein
VPVFISLLVAALAGCGNGLKSATQAGPTPGTLAFDSATASVAQIAGTIALSVDRTGGADGAVSVNFTTVNGTALAGTHYTSTSGTLSWAAGDSSAKIIAIPISTSAAFTGTLSFTVTLSGVAGGASLGATATETITITATPTVTPVPGTLALTASAVTVQQASGTIALSVSRSGGINGAVGVSYATANGTAIAGTHYTATSGTLSWADGDSTNKIINVPILSTTVFNGTVSFTVTLSSPTGGATLGTSTETVTINATLVPGTLALAATTATVAQTAGTIALTVNRTVGTGGAVGISYATSDGTAAAGTNYTSTSGTLSWAAGDSNAKTINVPITTNVAFSGSITFTLTLSSPTGGATLGTNSAEIVTITTAGPYSAFSNYYTLPYTGTPNFKSLGTSLLHVTASIAADASHTGTNASYILDTGSTGVVMPASELAGHTACLSTDPAGSITYSSSGLMLTGCWVNAVISFPTAVNQNSVNTTMTATLPVLAVVTVSCTGSGVNSGNCVPGGTVHMLGIGFGRGTTTYESPAYNPFANVKEMAAGTMRRGYVYTASGIQVGLTNATVPLGQTFGYATSNTFIAEQLTPSNAFPGYAYDWNAAPASFVYAGTATATGTILFDTGLTDMILENSGVAGGTSVPNGTAITINAMPSLVSYSFNSGDGGAATPSSVTWATYSHGVFVNVGNHFLGKYDYLYDADGGILGLRPVTR